MYDKSFCDTGDDNLASSNKNCWTFLPLTVLYFLNKNGIFIPAQRANF